MTAVIFSFPQHPVRVLPARDGGWLVVWRSCGWLHASIEDALVDSRVIAAAHGVRVIATGGSRRRTEPLPQKGRSQHPSARQADRIAHAADRRHHASRRTLVDPDRAAVIAIAVLQIVDTAPEHAVLWQIENYLRDEIADLECQLAAERGVSDA